MKIKDFLRYMIVDKNSHIEICDLNISRDNRTELTLGDIVDEVITKGLGGKYADMELKYFSFQNNTLTIYAE